MTFSPTRLLNDPERIPRWYKSPVLDTVEERARNDLWFVPNRAHPALRDLSDVHLGGAL